jgi:ubiquinone/menaquinone biosynthesis C-methylase UbiE
MAAVARELTSDLIMLERAVSPGGRNVVDIGCGGGALARALAARGARVTGVETSETQLAEARSRADGVRYLIGRAESLPLPDASVDVALFMRTLHHVPAPAALREAWRVLRPGGVAYVAEPLAEGDFFGLVSLVEDEREVRAAAQRAIAEAPSFERVQTVEYEVRVCVPGLAALRERTVSVDPSRASMFDARTAELTEAFERLGEPGERPGERCFVQPMRADLLRR